MWSNITQSSKQVYDTAPTVLQLYVDSCHWNPHPQPTPSLYAAAADGDGDDDVGTTTFLGGEECGDHDADGDDEALVQPIDPTRQRRLSRATSSASSGDSETRSSPVVQRASTLSRCECGVHGSGTCCTGTPSLVQMSGIWSRVCASCVTVDPRRRRTRGENHRDPYWRKSRREVGVTWLGM